MPRRKPRQRRAYDTDLTDGQWKLIAPLIPEANPGGRPRKAASRALVNAILYFLRAGMAWRLLPHDLPPWQTVYYYFRRWDREGVWRRVHHTLVMADRERAGREPSPSAAVLDSQTVRTADQTYGPPRVQAACIRWRDQSAQTYPACRLAGRCQDGDPRVPFLIKGPASVSHFAPEVHGTPIDRQAIFLSPLAARNVR